MPKMSSKLDNKGISLALTIGLLLLLVMITTTINELVLRALRASHQIEASDKAYFAAEAGIEDALYELSAHTAGYTTAPLDDPDDVRNTNFSDSSIKWKNDWEIANKNLNDCTDDWKNSFVPPEYCGRIYEGEKLVINIFSDDASSAGVGTNEISDTAMVINTLELTEFTIKFRLPLDVVEESQVAFGIGANPLEIDNDRDYDPEFNTGINEDGLVEYQEAFVPDYTPAPCPYSAGLSVEDNDCDGLQNEDSKQDPVVLWKLLDNQGNTFTPMRGCIFDFDHYTHPGTPNANICETTFRLGDGELFAEFDQEAMGTDQNGAIVSLKDFIGDVYGIGNDSTLQMEILAVAPFEAINKTDRVRVVIPYLEYGITYTANEDLPATFFAIKSDGYYQDFKQSITTNVVPRATTKLLDLTIIQQ